MRNENSTSITERLSSIAGFAFFPLLIIARKRRIVLYSLFFTMTISLCGCFLNFFKTDTQSSVDANTLSSLTDKQKSFIIHFANGNKALQGAYVKDDSLYGSLFAVPPEHLKYMEPKPASKRNRVLTRDKEIVLTEVHLYTNSGFPESSPYTAAVTSFYRTDIYELNKN
jgi:hypothetical protein